MMRLAALILSFGSAIPLGYGQSLAGSMIKLDSARSGATIPVFVNAAEQASATLVLLPGGAGGIGKVAGGWPDGGNFLVRSAPAFHAAGFNIAIVARPSDLSDLDNGYRAGSDHADDLRRVVLEIRKRFTVPVWLVGTSRGTVSAASAGILLGGENIIDGIVLTSTITNLGRRPGAVPTLELGKISVPVLVVHHEMDVCRFCRPKEAEAMLSSFKSAPVRRFSLVKGGAGMEGDPCEPFHYHGYVGIEKDVVKLVADWVKAPAN